MSGITVSGTLTTLTVCAGTVVVSALIGIPAGWAVRGQQAGNAAILIIAISALALPPVVHGAAWLNVISREAALNSIAYCILIQGFAFAPIAAIVFAAAANRYDPELDDAVRLESKGVTLQMTRLKLLYLRPLLAVALTVAMLAGTTIAITDLLLVRTLAETTFTKFQTDGYAGTALLFLTLTILGAVLAWKFCPRLDSQPDRHEPPPAPCCRYLYLGMVPLIIGTLVPIYFLQKQGGGIMATVMRSAEFEAETKLSLITASASALIGLSIAWTIAWYGLRDSHRTQKVTAAWLTASLLTPGCLVGMGLIQICARPSLFWLYDSPGILVVAQTLRILPYQVLAITPFALSVPDGWIEQAWLDARLNRRNLFRLLALPLAPGLLAALMIGFAMAAQEIDASSLVAPPGTPPLSLRFFTLLHYGLYPDVASMGVLLMAAGIVPAGIAYLCFRKLVKTSNSSRNG